MLSFNIATLCDGVSYTNSICLVEEMTVSDKILHLFARCKHYLTTLNIFPSVPTSTDEYELNRQRISTRLFLVIFIVSLIVLLFYNSVIMVQKTVKVETPSFTEYSDLNLNSAYNETLTCPCSKISITYGKFIQIEYTLHQVCSSIFVSQPWFKCLSNIPGNLVQFGLPPLDFRASGKISFQALRSFCELINSTILNNRIQFYSNQYVSAFVIPPQLLNFQIESLTDQFRSSMTNSFLLSLATIRDTTGANTLLSGRLTNYKIVIPDGEQIRMYPSYYTDNCTCLISRACIDKNGYFFHDYNLVSKPLFNVPEFYCGCYFIEALLQSSLKCFYDQLCVKKLESHLMSSVPMTIIPLDASVPSNYLVNSVIEELVNNLMIEEWNVSMIYETYYNECQPAQCTYKIQARNNIIYIVTTLFGITGGLATALKLIVPRVVKLVRKKRVQQQQQQQQQQQPETGKIKLKTAKCTTLKL